MGTKVGNYCAKGHSSKAFKRYGERSSVGRAPDCDSGRRGFESHRSPQFRTVQLALAGRWAVSSVGRAADS